MATERNHATLFSGKRASIALIAVGVLLVLAALALLYRGLTPRSATVPTTPSQKHMIELEALHDTFAWDAQPDSSFGEWETLFAWEGAHAFVGFPTQAIPRGAQLVSATLTLVPHDESTAASETAVAELVHPEARWDETSVTWASQPAVDTRAGEAVTVLSEAGSGKRDVWDVTTLVRHALDHLPPSQLSTDPTRSPTIGFRLRLAAAAGARQEWWTADSDRSGPTLTLTFEDLETCCASVRVEPEEAESAGCTAVANPSEGWCGLPIALDARAAPGWTVQEAEGPGTLQHPAPECSDLAVRFGRSADTVCGVDPRVRPLDAAGTVSANPSTCPCGNGPVQLEASAREGWVFDHWEGYAEPCGDDPTCVVACPDGGVEPVVAVFAPRLDVRGRDAGVTCTPRGIADHPILTFTLCASEADDWHVDAVGIRTSRDERGGTGPDQLTLIHGGSPLDRAKLVEPGERLVRFEPSELTVNAGECIELSAHYRFDRTGSGDSDQMTLARYAVEVDRGFIDASPVRHAPGTISGGASGYVQVGSVINSHSLRAFDAVQVAVDDPLTKDLHTLIICPGEHTENVRVTKSLTLSSARAGEETVLRAASTAQPVVETMEEMTVIEGLTIRDARRAWGVLARRGVTLHDCQVTDNEGGIYTADGSFSADGLTVEGNDGPAIVASTLDDVVMQNIQVLNNGEDGLLLTVGPGGGGLGKGLLLRGEENRIANNGGDGIRAVSGNVTLEASTEVVGNRGWGIRADEGSISVPDDAVYTVTANGGGGLYAAAGIGLPSGFVVERNGGPGIVVWSSRDTRLEDISVRDNRGVGIGVVVTGHAGKAVVPGLILGGDDNQITNNGGGGIVAAPGSVTIRGQAEISGNGGWGIVAEGGSVFIAEGAMDALRDNERGGLFAGRNLTLPVGFTVEGNGGPGIVVWGDDDTELTDVIVQDNLGGGVTIAGGAPWRPDALPSLILRGANNRIVGNQGNGLHASPGAILVSGGTQIRDNGGWGIFGQTGPVTVLKDTLEGVTGNDLGGISASGGLSLPEGFLVVGNGGPGIRLQNCNLQLTDVQIRKNAGHGIDLERAGLVVLGTDSDIQHNRGDGLRAYASAVNVTQADISHNDGWGVYAYGAGPLAMSSTTLHGNALGGILGSDVSFLGHRLTVNLNEGHGLMLSRGSLSIRDGQISSNEGYGVYAAAVQPKLVDLVVSGNTSGGIAFETWHDDWADVGPEQKARREWDTPVNWPAAADSMPPGIHNCRIAENGDDGVTLFGGLTSLAVEESDFLDNAGYALVNADGGVTVSASGNWWGQTADPRDQIRGSVECEPWAPGPRSLTVVPDEDPTYVPRGVSDSAVIRVLDWTGLARTAVLTISDAHGWLTGPRATMVSLDDDGETLSLLSIRVPPDVPLGTTNPVSVLVASEAEPSSARARVFDMIVAPVADLTVSAGHVPPQPLAGQLLTHTVVISNRGPDDASGVVLTATLPTGSEFATLRVDQGSCSRDKGTLSCRIGRIAEGHSVNLTLSLHTTTAGTIATLLQATADEHDPTPFDNQYTEYTPVAPVVPLAAVSIEGPRDGLADQFLTLRAMVEPLSATVPVTYTWRATHQWWPGRVRRSYSLSDSLEAMWHVPGEHVVTVTAQNAIGRVVSQTHTITIETLEPSIFLPLVLRGT